MRSDGKSVTTKAVPERCWALWSDTTSWVDWNPDIETVDIGGPVKQGAAGTMTTKSGGKHNIKITEVKPGHSFTLESDGVPASRLHFTCSVEASAGGGSTLTQSVSIAGPLSFLFGPLMGPQIAKSFPPLLEGLARKAESS